MLQSRAATCNLFKTNYAIAAKIEPSSTLCSCCKPKKVAKQAAKEGIFTLCNLPASFLATPLQHKLQRKLQHATIAVGLDSTSCNDFRDFLKALQVAA